MRGRVRGRRGRVRGRPGAWYVGGEGREGQRGRLGGSRIKIIFRIHVIQTNLLADSPFRQLRKSGGLSGPVWAVRLSRTS